MSHHFGRPLAYLGYGGQGKQVRDFLHVADLCGLLLEQVEHFDAWDGWVGNVAGGVENSASLLELTNLCREITGNSVPLERVPANRPNDLRLFIGDCARLHQRTPWRPRRPVRDILSDTARWVAQNETALSTLNA